MNRLLLLIFSLIGFAGCSTQPVAPVSQAQISSDRIDVLAIPNTSRRSAESPEEADKLAPYSGKAFRMVLGEPLPDSLSLVGYPDVGVYSPNGEVLAIGCVAKISKADFKARIVKKGWREVPVPTEMLGAMHLPSDVPKDYMTCFVGRVNGKTAMVLWSEYDKQICLEVEF